MASGDSEFFYALISSASFYHTAIWWAVLSLALLSLSIPVWIRLRSSLSSLTISNLHKDERGSSVAIDFVLTLPIFLTLILLIVQYALMSHTALLVHYSAYNAARSARVWMWDKQDVRPWPRLIPALRTPSALKNSSEEVQQRAETAARFALIAASPADVSIKRSAAQIPNSVLRAMAKVGGLADREAVLINKARYAFDPSNTVVNIKQATSSLNQPGVSADAGQPGDAWAVTAEVTFRMSLDIPIAARLLGTARGDGSYYETSTAEVTLL